MSTSTERRVRTHSPMRSMLEAKKTSLELKRKKNIKRSNRILISLTLLFIILISNTYYFKNTFLLEVGIVFYIMGPIISFLYIIIKSISSEDEAFLKIMESLELIDKGQTDPEVRKHAAEKLEDATNDLEGLLGRETARVSPLWHSKIKELEKDFIRKLKYRAVPALRDGRLGSIRIAVPAQLRAQSSKTEHVLEHIALVFIKSDTKQMEIVNDILEDYDEIVTIEKSKLRSFYGSRIGKSIVALVSGYALLSVITFIYAIFFNQNFYGIISNPSIFILGGLTTTVIILQLLRKE